jgi:hypothetical protein
MADRFDEIFGPGRHGKRLREGPEHRPAEREPDDDNTLMLDPSVLFRPRDKLIRDVESVRSGLGLRYVYVAREALAALEDDASGEVLWELGGAPALRLDPHLVREAVGEAGVQPWDRPPSAVAEYAWLRERLQSQRLDDRIVDTRFDEWFYLTHSSTIVSRVKRPFTQLARAGALAVELMTPPVDRIVRRTLRLDELEPVKRAQRLRALGKWTAVGGDAALTFVAPWAAAAGTALTGGFLLIDP